MVQPSSEKELEQSMERLIAKLLPNILKDKNNTVRNGIISSVNTSANIVDVRMIGAGEVLTSIPYIATEEVLIGSRCLVLSSDPTLKSASYALVFPRSTSTTVADGGWKKLDVIPTRQSSDDPTYVLRFTGADMTNTLSVPMKLKIRQDGVDKYLHVSAVGAYSSVSETTDVTVYGGTDYDVSASSITSISYSTEASPLGFPSDPAKWTVTVTDTGNRTQATPVAGTWYNLGSVSISIPIGIWLVRYSVWQAVDKTTATFIDVYTTLSTANNTESDASTTAANASGPGAAGYALFQMAQRQRFLTLASKTTYFLNTKTSTASTNLISNRGDVLTTKVEAVFQAPY